VESLEVNGNAPQLAGLRCDAILAVEFWHAGQLVESANIAHLCFGGIWHRLYFDYGVIFWRPGEHRPESYEAPELGSSYPVVDVAAARGLLGVRLACYKMSPIAGGARVIFSFEGGQRLAFSSVDDVTSYHDA
jgi:hypothetical protein